jgi:hypothetical protein
MRSINPITNPDLVYSQYPARAIFFLLLGHANQELKEQGREAKVKPVYSRRLACWLPGRRRSKRRQVTSESNDHNKREKTK